MWGAHHRLVQNERGEDVLLVIKPLALKDKNFVQFIYEDAIKRARDLGVVTELELRTRLKNMQIWDDSRDEMIITTTNRIQELEETLSEQSGRKLRMTKSLISSLKEVLRKETVRKAELFYSSAEHYAAEARSSAIIYCSTYDEEENRWWKNWNEFLNESDFVFMSNIIKEINEIKSIGNKEVRELARSPQWRYLWNGAKGNIKSLFGRNLGDMDMSQRNLMYWSQVYDSVYEAYERPSDDIINDDEALDKWFEEQNKKRKVERFEKKGDVGKLKLSDRIKRHKEVFIVANQNINPYEDLPTIQEIEEMNPDRVRKFKREEQKRLKESKQLTNEKDLRNTRASRMIIGSTDQIHERKGFGGNNKKGKRLPGGTIKPGGEKRRAGF